MGAGILTNDGRIWKSELYKLAAASASPLAVQGPHWCAAGNGDGTFTDPNSPPVEDVTQIGLKGELIRKKFTGSDFLVETGGGAITWATRTFNTSVNPTDILLLQYNFGFLEGNFTWKEIGFFAGDVAFGRFYNAAVPPLASGITGITINYVSPQNGTGSGLLDFTASGTTATWRAPGSATPGPAINIGAGGAFTLADGVDSSKIVRIQVVGGSLPLSNTNVTPSIDPPGDVALNGLNSVSNPTGQVARNGRLFVVRTIIDNPKTVDLERPVRFLVEP